MAKIAIDLSTGKKYLIKNTALDFHTASGSIAALDLEKNGRVKSNKGSTFCILDINLADYYELMARGPQIVNHKDAGMIISKTGVNSTSRILDAGGGSGALCIGLANVARNVAVYEINAEHYDVIAKNIKMLGITNITLNHADVYKGIDETDLDLITLDLPEPHRVLPYVSKALRDGGHLVVYIPNLTQAQEFMSHLKGSKVSVIEMLELIERKWKIEDKILRPEFDMLGHTGFLIFCRKW